MLKEIHFHNWKSFKQATLYLDQLTVLIGTNASGKSNIVEGLEFLRRVTSGQNIQTALASVGCISKRRVYKRSVIHQPNHHVKNMSLLSCMVMVFGA